MNPALHGYWVDGGKDDSTEITRGRQGIQSCRKGCLNLAGYVTGVSDRGPARFFSTTKPRLAAETAGRNKDVR